VVNARSFSLDRFVSGYCAVSSNLETDDGSKMAYFTLTRGYLPYEFEKLSLAVEEVCRRFEGTVLCSTVLCTMH